MVYGILLALLILAAIFLVIFVLMQSDKGGGLAGSLGGMGGGGMPFSGREAATILTKATTGLAIAFMAICILLNILSRNRAQTSANSALQKRARKLEKVRSQSAGSVLDQMNLPQPEERGEAQPSQKQEQGKVNIPGVTGTQQPEPESDK